MKRVRLLNFLIILFFSLCLLMSCSQDLSQTSSNQETSDNTNQEAEDTTQETAVVAPSIQGTWYWLKDGKEYFIRLNENGKGILHYWQNYGGRLTGYVNIEIVSWGYNAETSNFSITVKGQIAGMYSVDYLTESTLKLSKIKGRHDIGFGLTDSELTR